MASLIFISHPEVLVEPAKPVPNWGLNDIGRERAARFARSDIVSEVEAIWSSTETKAQQTARALADHLNIEPQEDVALGENDRSATGFMPPSEFEAAADAFFADPERSFRGWERALDAQDRVFSAVKNIIQRHTVGDLAIVSHGAVGTLLFCALSNKAIDRAYDQPGQGHFWTADLSDLVPRHSWKSID